MHTVRRQRDVRATAKGVRWHAYLGHAHTRLPLSSATWAHFCISRNRPRAVANRRQWAGGPPTADLSNYTRRAGRRRPAPPGPTRCRGAHGIRPLPGPAQRPAGPGRAVAAELQPAKRAAGGPKPTPGRRCGPGAACKPVASDWRWATARTSPPDGSCRCVTDPQTALPSTTTALAR